MSWVTDTRNGMHLDVGLMIKEGAPLVIQCTGNFTYDPLLMHPRVDLEIFCNNPAVPTAPGAPTVGVALPRTMNTLDPSCMEFARQCIRQCQNEHPRCAKLPTRYTPTRVLDLGENDGSVIKLLCDSDASSAGWAALSHCWGTETKPPMLNAKNLQDWISGIDRSALPPTFSNAVDVCRALSIRYLWIDSICILQDDPKDWEREATRMGDVYQHAELVIVGASSKGPEVPFLGPREDEWGTKTFHFETPFGDRLPLHVRKRRILAAPLDQGHYDPPFTDHWATWKQAGPLYSRGWCFQEAYLAGRALHFAPGSLIYQCKTHRRSQESMPPYSLVYPGTFEEVSDYRKWHLLVKLYTARQLTFASDKLPAVSGLAVSMPQAGGSRYLAGLWSESLLVDLLWHVSPTGNRSKTPMAYPPSEHRAPSWSWASVKQGVLWNEYKNFEPLAQVMEAKCSVTEAAPFGAVSGGHLKLKARLKPCIVTHDRHKGQHHAYYIKPDGTKAKMRWFLGDGMLIPTVQEDSPQQGAVCRRYNVGMETYYDDFDGASALFLCLGRTGSWHYDHVGLVVAPSLGNPGCLERIGTINCVSKDWYDEGEERVVTVI
ncbi:heterokaryon incompatibility protein-domain-containing protein [Stachybotrys elegans]|uniref:Heterokaryon incompatibility protein-domain-containing protein n=1 Tax=Stachybotrys elegans TaxID=80388 RepID=A0A8K0SM09_9HYPO|nr:heterokaryon incompatibility protein-domain-containing protein [Stachybotrys elegans]